MGLMAYCCYKPFVLPSHTGRSDGQAEHSKTEFDTVFLQEVLTLNQQWPVTTAVPPLYIVLQSVAPTPGDNPGCHIGHLNTCENHYRYMTRRSSWMFWHECYPVSHSPNWSFCLKLAQSWCGFFFEVSMHWQLWCAKASNWPIWWGRSGKPGRRGYVWASGRYWWSEKAVLQWCVLTPFSFTISVVIWGPWKQAASCFSAGVNLFWHADPSEENGVP